MRVLSLLLLISNLSFADTYKFKNESKVFWNLSDKNLRISKWCSQDGRKFNCKAWDALQTVKKGKSFFKELHSHNIGAQVCHAYLNGKVIRGKNEHGENTFCYFEDESILDNGTISFYINK
jgi:hypothetical protein